jgi:hypothetical protein
MTDAPSSATEEPTLFESRQLTPAGEYTSGIEGPAVDSEGTLYVVNFLREGTIGKVSPGATQSELFAALPDGCIGNGIRFDREGRMYVADFKKHNVFVFERDQTVAGVYFHSDRFNQPNDLAVAADGTLYASDPSFSLRTGQIWRITRGPGGEGQAQVMVSERRMGITNGLDLSPDGGTLYVSESITPEIWAYRLEGEKLTAPRLLKNSETSTSTGCGPMSRAEYSWRALWARPWRCSHPTGLSCAKSPFEERSRRTSPSAALMERLFSLRSVTGASSKRFASTDQGANSSYNPRTLIRAMRDRHWLTASGPSAARHPRATLGTPLSFGSATPRRRTCSSQTDKKVLFKNAIVHVNGALNANHYLTL